MPKKKQVFEPENLESIRSAISGLIVEPPETIEPVVYSVDLLSRHDPYYPMVQGEATSRLAMTATRNMAINPITGDAVIEDEGFRAFFEGYDGLKIGLTVGAQKLLSTAALYLTQNNHYRPEESARIETEVQIPLISYARLLGYPVDERETATPEEAEKEKRRIKNLMKDVRGKINDQLDVLYSLSLSWSEKKGRVSDYQDVRLLQRKGVKRGMISIQFSDDIARYLLCSYVMQYPEALLSIDERSPRAYRVGYKLAYHSSVRRNIERGTADIISVSALLDACGDIPDFDEVQKTDRGHWENRIKTPLETALDSCVRAGVLDPDILPKDCTAVLGTTKSARITTMINSILRNSDGNVRVGTEENEAFLALRDFMYATVYVDKTAKREEQKVDKVIGELYDYYLNHIDRMSNFYVQLAYQEGRDRAVTDYISGMSDEFAIRTFEELFVPQKWHVL